MTQPAQTPDFASLRRLGTEPLRRLIREGRYTGHTAGLAPDKLQVNLAILPQSHALDFLRYCQRNPKPCPLVGVSDTGNPILSTLGRDLDVRSDAPGYNIYRDGTLVDSPTDIRDLWTDDLVAFALGCSFTFEDALSKVGIPMWHVENNTTVPMFRSTIETRAAGPFGGGMVVSMRAIPSDRVAEVQAICARFPQAHGAPVHVGDPSAIGITDLQSPDWGDPAPLGPGDVPAFWACGVTPQAAILRAGLPLCISHRPGHMLITDVAFDAEFPFVSD